MEASTHQIGVKEGDPVVKAPMTMPCGSPEGLRDDHSNPLTAIMSNRWNVHERHGWPSGGPVSLELFLIYILKHVGQTMPHTLYPF